MHVGGLADLQRRNLADLQRELPTTRTHMKFKKLSLQSDMYLIKTLGTGQKKVCALSPC